jgi:hypothetical protein
MNDTNTSGPERSSGDVASELRDLGENLKNILIDAWESEERKNLQNEIKTGLANLGQNLDQAAKEFKESEAGQRFRTETEDLHRRFRSGEVETRVREDLIAALRKINTELEKILSPKSPPGTGE